MLLETLSVKLQGDTSDFVAKINSASQVVENLGARMQAVGAKMQAMGAAWSATITLPLVALGKASLDSAAKFEQSMNIIEQVSGATAAQMRAMSDQALKLGKDTVFSANEAAGAQLELAKAGFTTQQVMDAMPGILNLAAAANIETAQAALVAGGAINAFNLSASESTRIADMLAAAANASSADVSDMALAFQQSTAAMALYGQTADATATAIALLANAGIRGSDAGTSLKVAMMRLAAPSSDEAAAMIKNLGIQVYDAAGQMRSLRDILADFERVLGPGAKMVEHYGGADKKLSDAAEKARAAIGPLTATMQEQQVKLQILQRELSDTIAKYGEGSTQVANKRLAILKLNNDLDQNSAKYSEMVDTLRRYDQAQASATSATVDVTEAFRNQALQTIFGADAIRTISVLLGEGVAGWDKMNSAVNQSGAAQDVANARMKGLAGAIEYFKGTIDSLMIETALPWLNTLSNIVRSTADWIAKFGQLDPVLQKNIVIFLALAAAMGPVLFYAGMLFSVVGSLISIFSIFLNPIVAIGVALLTLLLPMDKVNRMFGTMKSVALRTLEVMQAGVMSALNHIEKTFGVNLSSVKRIVEVTFDVIRRVITFGFFRVISDLLRSRWTEWKAKLIEMGRALLSWAYYFGKYILSILRYGDYLNDWLSYLPWPIKGLARSFGWMLDIARDAIIGLVKYARAKLPEWIATLKVWGMAAWQWITDIAIPYALTKLGEWGNALWGWLKRRLPEWAGALWEWAKAAWQWIVDMAPVAMAKLGEWATVLYAYIKSALPGWLAVLSEWKTAFVQWIIEALPAALDDLSYFVTLIYEHLKKGIIALWPMLVEAGQILWQWIVEVTPTVLTEIGNLLGAVWNWLKSWVVDPTKRQQLVDALISTWNWFKDWTLYIWDNYLSPGLTAVWGWLKSWVEDPVKRQQLIDSLWSAWDWFKKWAGIVWDIFLAPGLNASWAWLKSWVVDPVKRQEMIDSLKEKWDWFKEWAWGIWETHLLPNLTATWDWLKSWVIDPVKRQELIDTLNEKWDWFKEWAMGIWETIKPYLVTALEETKKWIDTNYPTFGKWIDEVGNFAVVAKGKFDLVKDYLMDVGRGFASELPAMSNEVTKLGATISSEIPRIVAHFNDLWGTLSGGRNGQQVGQFLGKFATTAIKALGTILTQVRAIMDAFDILVNATGAILSGNFTAYWGYKDQWNKAWSDFGGATADQWKQFQSIWQDTMQEVPAPTGPYLGTQPTGGVSGNGVTVTLNQTFNGNVDAATVASASQQGILQGLRQVGLA